MTLCGFQEADRIPGNGQVEGNLGGLRPLIHNPTDCHRRQDTGYKIQETDAAYTYKHTGVEGYEDASMQGCRGHRLQATGIKQMPRSLVAPLKRAGGS